MVSYFSLLLTICSNQFQHLGAYFLVWHGMARDSWEKMAFTTPFGLYKFQVMPFVNAPPTFPRTMNEVLRDCQEFCKVYINDVAVYSLMWKPQGALDMSSIA